MIKDAIRTGLIGLLSTLSLAIGTAHSAEYMYRDVAGNSLTSPKCAAQSEASAHAQDAYNLKKFTKTFCEVQGYGWHVEAVKNEGKLVCEECRGDNNDGKYQCHMEDIEVTCKRLKPGSVGMLPGKG